MFSTSFSDFSTRGPLLNGTRSKGHRKILGNLTTAMAFYCQFKLRTSTFTLAYEMPAIATLDSGPLLITWMITRVSRYNHAVSMPLNVKVFRVTWLPVEIRGLVGLSFPTIHTFLEPVWQTNVVPSCRKDLSYISFHCKIICTWGLLSERA